MGVGETGTDSTFRSLAIPSPVRPRHRRAPPLLARYILVADGTAALPLATLLDAPAPLRLAPAYFPGDSWTFESSNALGTASVSIDASESDAWLADGALHLLEIAFDSPCPASELYLGGNPATPDWNRYWEGGVSEFILLDDSAPANALAIVRAYLGLKWSLPFDFETQRNARSVLAQLGIQSDPLYSTILLFR